MFLMISVVLGFCFALWRLLRAYNDPINKVPGPVGKPFIGSTFDFIWTTPRDMFVKFRGFAKEYGDRFLINVIEGPILYIQNVNDVEIVLSHSKNIKKSKPYMFLKSWLGTGLLLSNGPKWHRRRKILTPTFHFNILKSFLIVMDEQSQQLVEKLKEVEGTAVNLIPLISDVTLLTICETAMGTQLDSNKSAESIEYKNNIMELCPIILKRLRKIWLHNEYIFKKFPIGKKFEKCLHSIQSFADKVILERKKARKTEDSNEFLGDKSKRRLAMLDLLLEVENKGEIDLEGIREEVNTFMFEGHDTTARALVFSLMLIADHEEVQERIYEEVQNILGNSNGALTMSDLSEMTYLQAVIKESLRLYPSVPVIARKVCEEFMLGDLLIKKGVDIVVNIYDLHRRADLFPNPEEFKPERFLTEKLIHPYAFVPFSAGPRNCIGQRFAMLEMKCVLSYVCRNFKLYPQTKGARPELLTDILIKPVEPIYVKFVRR